MTNQTTNQNQAQATRGRPLSDRGRRTRAAVSRYVQNAEGVFTTYDVRKATKQNKVAVRNRLNALEREGAIRKVGEQPTGKRGRPVAQYETVEQQ